MADFSGDRKNKEGDESASKEKQSKRNREGNAIDRMGHKDTAKRRSEREKVLINDGELRKAFAMMAQRGVAPTSTDILPN